MERLRERWLLPEGMEELVPPQSVRVERIRRALLDLFVRWGYEIVTPPLIEYLESLLTGTGEDLELHTFKLIDQMTGRMMGLRADMTPQVARIDAHRLRRSGPARLCYVGTVLHTLPRGHLGRAEPDTDRGGALWARRMGERLRDRLSDAGSVGGCRVSGPVHLDMGHVGIYRALARRAALPSEREGELHEVLQRKAKSEARELLDIWGVDARYADALVALAELDGHPEVLGRAERELAGGGEAVERALGDLGELVRSVRARRPGVDLHVNLAELRGYRYHTGFVFAAFVPGYGQEVARGGRYDEIGSVFGRARAATGFSTDLKTLIALQTAGDDLAAEDVVSAPWSDDPELLGAIRELRSRSQRVIQRLPGEAARNYRRLERRGGQWVVVDEAPRERSTQPGKTGERQ